ncbi:MAG: hypothetical protein WCK18_15805 [Prolixibacteraceae bacterium]
MKDYNDKTEQETRQEIAQTEQGAAKLIDNAFNKMCIEVFSLSLVKVYISRGQALPISETKQLTALSGELDNVIGKTLQAVYTQLRAHMLKSWQLGEKLGIASIIDKVPANVLQSLFDRGVFAHREKAAAAFIDRTTRGLALSDRVWSLEPALKLQIETTLQLAVQEGRSALDAANDLRIFLRDPDRLFRRVKDEAGNLQLSRAALNYHPGKGVYRSAIKNAHRLARTEINKAYRRADWAQMQDLPFVTGQHIKTSNNHPIADICDELAGVYPKTFVWSGWHPQCRCHMIKVLVDAAQFVEMQSGEFTPSQITSYPEDFANWAQQNRDRIKQNSGIDWIEDNPEVLAMFENMKTTN